MELLIIILTSKIILLLLSPVTKFLIGLWEFLVKICNCGCCCSTNLREKYGEWAVITGATDGIGKEYAKEFARRNMNLVLISRSVEKLSATKEEISKIYPDVEIIIIRTDFSVRDDDLSDIETQLDEIPVGILVNNVGRLTDYPMYFDEIPRKDLWDMMNLNISATVIMTHMVIKSMKERGKGAIINLSSATASAPLPLMSVYAASKLFVKNFSAAIRYEYSSHGITVQSLSPFFVKTKMTGYSPRAQSLAVVCPDASTYVASAIETLGRLDDTTGYWFHDITTFFTLLFPVWMRIRVGFLINTLTRNEYLANQQNVC